MIFRGSHNGVLGSKTSRSIVLEPDDGGFVGDEEVEVGVAVHVEGMDLVDPVERNGDG